MEKSLAVARPSANKNFAAWADVAWSVVYDDTESTAAAYTYVIAVATIGSVDSKTSFEVSPFLVCE